MPQAYSNLIWLYSTFTSRATAESLLSPELESGNLTTRDYDNAIRFLPGPHRRYPVRSLPSLCLFLRSHLASVLRQMELLLALPQASDSDSSTPV